MKKYRWYLNRLRVMTFSEIILRIWRGLKNRAQSMTGIKGMPHSFSTRLLNLLKGKHFPAVKFLLAADSREEQIKWFNKLFPEQAKVARKQAELVCAHEFAFLSRGPTNLGREIGWTRGWEKGLGWPMEYWSKIDYRQKPELGDIKLPWELSRHQYFLVLGKAYWLGGDEKYAREFVDQLASWIKANPPGLGINWIIKLDMGIRLISWMGAYYFFERSPSFSQEMRLAMLESMYVQARHIYKNLSFGSSANNHLIGQAAALFLAGTFFSGFKWARKWQDKGKRILSGQSRRQVCGDGVSREQSTGYHAFVLDFYLLVMVAARRNKIALDRGTEKRVEKMCQFLAALKKSFGQIPLIGDGDQGQAVKFSLDSEQDYDACLATGAVLFRRGDFRQAAGKLAEKTFWLLGAAACRDFKKPGTGSKKDGSFVFPEGGYFILNAAKKGKQVSLLFDCGPLGLGKPAGHGHADALAFILAVNGSPILIDPGTYTYSNPPEWRAYFRGSPAHNTLTVDGQDQSLAGGDFIWLKKARVFLTRWQSNENTDLAAGYHTGYLRLPDPLIHEREIECDKTRLILTIKDTIRCKKSHALAQYFHFAPGLLVQKIEDNRFRLKKDGNVILLELDGRCTPELFYGREEPPAGWYAPRFGEKIKVFSLKASYQAQGGCELITRIWAGGFKE